MAALDAENKKSPPENRWGQGRACESAISHDDHYGDDRLCDRMLESDDRRSRHPRGFRQ